MGKETILEIKRSINTLRDSIIDNSISLQDLFDILDEEELIKLNIYIPLDDVQRKLNICISDLEILDSKLKQIIDKLQDNEQERIKPHHK